MAGSTLAVRQGAAVLAPPRTVRPEFSIMAEYDRDLLTSFGQSPDVVSAGDRPVVTHADLVQRLLDGDPLGTVEPDLVMVSYALPDVHPFTTTSTQLNRAFGNRAASFAVAEQGLAAPFSALRVAAAYCRLGYCDQAVLAVLEQSTLPNDDPLVDGADLIDSGALLLLQSGQEGPGLSVHDVWTQTGPADCARRLAEVTAADRADTALVVEGPRGGHDTLPDGVEVHRHAERTYCTSVWLELAQNPQWAGQYDTVVLHDTDPRSGTCSAAVLRGAAHPEPSP
ncbi:hypothetical protein [Streptomyces sp. NBRC 110028]|uniref:hypothetical protein n=1 Tax=Streptomyces sp. NBRC 110028 TaxID=1621260 RepID=UPI0006E2F919|nr:hypothetical protein [Streptomyces sp. NBRC 110028]